MTEQRKYPQHVEKMRAQASGLPGKLFEAINILDGTDRNRVVLVTEQGGAKVDDSGTCSILLPSYTSWIKETDSRVEYAISNAVPYNDTGFSIGAAAVREVYLRSRTDNSSMAVVEADGGLELSVFRVVIDKPEVGGDYRVRGDFAIAEPASKWVPQRGCKGQIDIWYRYGSDGALKSIRREKYHEEYGYPTTYESVRLDAKGRVASRHIYDLVGELGGAERGITYVFPRTGRDYEYRYDDSGELIGVSVVQNEYYDQAEVAYSQWGERKGEPRNILDISVNNDGSIAVREEGKDEVNVKSSDSGFEGLDNKMKEIAKEASGLLTDMTADGYSPENILDEFLERQVQTQK